MSRWDGDNKATQDYNDAYRDIYPEGNQHAADRQGHGMKYLLIALFVVLYLVATSGGG